MKAMIATLALLTLTQAQAREIYKCQYQGVPLYSHFPCAPDARPVDLPELGRLGSHEDAALVRERLHALQSLSAPSRPAPPAAIEGRDGLSFGERTRLRKLEMRADNLRRDMLNRRGDTDWRRAMNQELGSLQKQINALRARQ